MDVRPDIGNICKSIPNQSIRRSANQKEGMAKPRNTRTVTSLSQNEFCLQAEITPAGMAINSVRKSEIAFMETVSGSLSFIFSSTGLASADIDLPKSK